MIPKKIISKTKSASECAKDLQISICEQVCLFSLIFTVSQTFLVNASAISLFNSYIFLHSLNPRNSNQQKRKHTLSA
jgi:nucleoside permease NupC